MQVIKSYQPALFPDMAPFTKPKGDARRSGKSVVDKILRLRRTLEPDEQRFLVQINACIEEIRSYSRLSDTQREELVLHAIERSMAGTFNEIAEDTKLHVDLVKAILASLETRGVIYYVRKEVPGSGRPWYLIKSRRVANVEAE